MIRILIAALLLVLAGCTDRDRFKPVVQQLELSQKEYQWPGPLQVAATVTDDQELVQLRLFVSGAFSKALPWQYTLVEVVDGASFQKTFSVAFPDSALAGYYSVSVGAVDASGNISADSIRYFHLRKPDSEPFFTNLEFQPPAINGVIQAAAGDTLIYNGAAVSPTDLELIKFEILDARHFQAQNLLSISLTDTLCTTFTFADTVILSTDLTDPEYFLVGRAIDSTGNQRRVSYLLQAP